MFVLAVYFIGLASALELGVGEGVWTVAVPCALYLSIALLVLMRVATLPSTTEVTVDDPQRVASLLEPLATTAGLRLPRVRVPPVCIPPVALGGGTVVVSAEVLRLLNDAQLEAVLAHELGHVGDAAPRLIARRQSTFWLAGYAGAVVVGVLMSSWAAALTLTATALPLSVSLTYAVSRGHRRRLETVADTYAARLGLDPRHLVDALRILTPYGDELIRRARGQVPLRWLMTPFIRSGTAHPALIKREQLLMLNESDGTRE